MAKQNVKQTDKEEKYSLAINGQQYKTKLGFNQFYRRQT